MQGQPPQGPPGSGYPPGYRPPGSPAGPTQYQPPQPPPQQGGYPQPGPYQPGPYQQGPQQPAPYQPGPYQPGPYQPGPPPGASAPYGAPGPYGAPPPGAPGPYGAPPPGQPYGYPLPRPPAPQSKTALYVVLGLAGLFVLFIVFTRLRAARYARDYEKQEEVRKEKETKNKAHIDEVTVAAKKKADAVKKALDACKTREGDAITKALTVAMKPGSPGLSTFRAPKKDDKPKLAGAPAYSMPTDKDPATSKPIKYDYGIASPWIVASGLSACPETGSVEADAVSTAAAALPPTYELDNDVAVADWEKKVDEAVAKLPKPKEIDKAQPPSVVAILGEDCTQTAVDSFIGTSGYGIGQKNEVYAYSCKYSVTWVQIADGAILAATVATSYASPKRYLPDNVTVDEITGLNSETSTDAEEKGAKSIKATLASWGAQ